MGWMQFLPQTTPPTPPTGDVRFFIDSATGKPAVVDDAGAVTLLGFEDEALLALNNLSDLDDAGDARDNLGLGTSAVLDVDTDATMAADSDTRVPSQKAVKSALAAAVSGLLALKGTLDCSANPNYPAASAGDTYITSVAGKVGGASGASVDVGDFIIAAADNAGGTQAAVGASWIILEHNLIGALLKANNLSDLASASTARTNLGLGSIATLNQTDLTPGSIGTALSLVDSSVSISAGVTVALLTTTITAVRTTTLPAASAYPAGARILFADMTGSLSATLTETFAAAGSDTINGGSSFIFSVPYAQAFFVSDGTSKWTVDRIGPNVVIDSFTTTGTWTKRAWAKEVQVLLFGPGGSGGSGRRGAAGGVRCGGGGGGSGGISSANFAASDLGATETVTIGAAGTAGAAVTANDTSGNNATASGASTFGGWLRAAGGGAGQGGTNATGTAGGAGTGTVSGVAGASASTTGGPGNAATNGTSSSASGASGGGITSGDVEGAGAAGGANNTSVSPYNSGGTGGSVPGGNGGPGVVNPATHLSTGAGSGAGSKTTTGGTGGDGTGFGAGAGGGGASLNGFNSGPGGTGGPGLCVVIQRG